MSWYMYGAIIYIYILILYLYIHIYHVYKDERSQSSEAT